MDLKSFEQTMTVLCTLQSKHALVISVVLILNPWNDMFENGVIQRNSPSARCSSRASCSRARASSASLSCSSSCFCSSSFISWLWRKDSRISSVWVNRACSSWEEKRWCYRTKTVRKEDLSNLRRSSKKGTVCQKCCTCNMILLVSCYNNGVISSWAPDFSFSQVELKKSVKHGWRI